jgi:anaerobic nitric oxide reductase flavorubredoxin
MAFAINDRITWVGKIDWELTTFHGVEYSTGRGTTYNAYLVRDQKTALIDTVWAPFAEEFIETLSRVVDPATIDFVIANHAEIDHSGALPRLMEILGDKPIYCTANGERSLKGHFHKEWNFQKVKTGDRLSLGTRELVFIEARMLHWPDSMFCYLSGEHALFSNDAFGQHLAAEHPYNDQVDPCELWQECIKYYANILAPFSSLVKRKIEEVIAMGVPVDMICPSHGVIWRKDPLQIVEQYLRWADDFRENQITIVYDTMWKATRRMAEAIARGISEEDPEVTVKILHSGLRDKNDIMTEVFRSKGILVGSPTINKGILSSVAGMLEEMRGLGFKKKRAAAFGSYGWSGEGVSMIARRLAEAGFEVAAGEGIKALWNPDEPSLDQCVHFGREMARFMGQ